MPFPDDLDYVWRWFLDLDGTRTVGMAANPITWPDMAAYFGLREIRPHAWELDLLRLLDGVALRAANQKREETKVDRGKEVVKPPPGKPRLRGNRKKR